MIRLRRTVQQFQQGPFGPSEILVPRRRTSSFFAAPINGAASHLVEQDDPRKKLVSHAGTVVFPGVLAPAQATGVSGKEFIAAAVSGYECGVQDMPSFRGADLLQGIIQLTQKSASG